MTTPEDSSLYFEQPGAVQEWLAPAQDESFLKLLGGGRLDENGKLPPPDQHTAIGAHLSDIETQIHIDPKLRRMSRQATHEAVVGVMLGSFGLFSPAYPAHHTKNGIVIDMNPSAILDIGDNPELRDELKELEPDGLRYAENTRCYSWLEPVNVDGTSILVEDLDSEGNRIMKPTDLSIRPKLNPNARVPRQHSAFLAVTGKNENGQYSVRFTNWKMHKLLRSLLGDPTSTRHPGMISSRPTTSQVTSERLWQNFDETSST